MTGRQRSSWWLHVLTQGTVFTIVVSVSYLVVRRSVHPAMQTAVARSRLFDVLSDATICDGIRKAVGESLVHFVVTSRLGVLSGLMAAGAALAWPRIARAAT